MGAEVKRDDKEPVRAKDVTKPWKTKFHECEDKGPTPPFNAGGFWKRPEHGFGIKEK